MATQDRIERHVALAAPLRRLRADMAAWGVKQKDIATAAGVCAATVCYVLSGNRINAKGERFARHLIKQAKAKERRRVEELG